MSTELTDILDGISYKELKGSNTIQATLTSIRATRVFRTRWADRLSFGRAMVGSITLGSDGSTSVTTPKQHPEVPGLFATGFDCEPFESLSRIVAKTTLPETDDPIDYDFARVTIRYEQNAGQFSTDPDEGGTVILRTEEVRVSAQVMQIPGSMFTWDSVTPAQPIENAFVGVNIGIVEDHVIFHRAATNKRATIKSLVGKVNNAAFLDAPRGSVLFLGAQSRRNVTTDGIQFWELQYTFQTRILPELASQADSWQMAYRQSSGWRKLNRSYDTTLSVYSYGDFNDLFT